MGKKAIKKKQKELAEKRKAAEEAAKKEGDAAEKKEGDAEEKKDVEMKDAEKKEEKAEEKTEEKKTEEKTDAPTEENAEEKKDEEKKDEEESDDDMGAEPRKVELTDEEKKPNFYPTKIKDLTEVVLQSSYGNFTIPQKAEGFDEIKFAWQKEAEAAEYLNKWRKEKKISSRIDDLQPGEWF